MTQQLQKLIIGGSEDIPAESSSDSQFQLYFGGDTLRVKTPRLPNELGQVGEICWSVNEDTTATLHLCITNASLDADGEVLVPAVWRSIILN